MFLRYVEDPEAVAAALGRVWGVFEAALARFHDDERTAEHLCRAPRYALRTAVRAEPWSSATHVGLHARQGVSAWQRASLLPEPNRRVTALSCWIQFVGASGRADIVYHYI